MREKQKKIIQWSSLALILLTGISVWRVNYEIDFMMDDEWYSTLLYADTPIRNLGDIVHAQIWHYLSGAKSSSTTRSFTCVKLPPSIFLRTKGTPLRT